MALPLFQQEVGSRLSSSLESQQACGCFYPQRMVEVTGTLPGLVRRGNVAPPGFIGMRILEEASYVRNQLLRDRHTREATWCRQLPARCSCHLGRPALSCLQTKALPASGNLKPRGRAQVGAAQPNPLPFLTYKVRSKTK